MPKDRSALLTSVASTFVANGRGEITAPVLGDSLSDIIGSSVLPEDVPALPVASGNRTQTLDEWLQEIPSPTPAPPDFSTYNRAYVGYSVGVNPLPKTCHAGGDTVGVTDVILGTVDIPYSNGNPQAIHAAGIAGIARTADPNQGAVGLFGMALANCAPGRVSQAFAANLVVGNKNNAVPNVPNQGLENCELYGLEIDVACERTPSGAIPNNVNIRGTWVTGNCEVQPYGLLAAHYVGYAGAFTKVPFKEGFRTMDGSCDTAFMAGFQPGAGAVGSQPIVFRSFDGNFQRDGQISADPGGNIVCAPGGGARFTWADGGWIPFNPVYGSATGAPASATATGRFIQRGKEVWFTVEIAITTNGSASGYLSFVLPSAPRTDALYIAAGRNSASGNMVQAIIGETGTSAKILNFNNTYPGTDNTTIVVSGVYEAA